MAFQNYYNPYANYYVPQYQSPQPQTPVQSTGIQWVQGKSAAQAFNVMPGQTVMLMDSESPTLYLKSTDQSGRPLPMTVYDLVERKDEEKPKASETTDYVKLSELEDYIRWNDAEKLVEQIVDKKMSEFSFSPSKKQHFNKGGEE